MINRRDLMTLCLAGIFAGAAGFPARADEDPDADTPTYGPPSDDPEDIEEEQDDADELDEKWRSHKAGNKRDRGPLGANIRVRGGSQSRTRIGGSIRIGN